MNALHQRVADVFGKAPFISHLEIGLTGLGDGWVETDLRVTAQLRQQHGFAHAGVVTTLADHTAGAAASTAVGDGQSVLTADFNVHLLRPATGDRLTCRGEIVKAGKTLIVTQADVWTGDKLCARSTGTMAVVDRAI